VAYRVMNRSIGAIRSSAPAPYANTLKRSMRRLGRNATETPIADRISEHWTAAPGGPAFFAYSTNYLIDTEHGVIVDVELTTAHRTAEVLR
jgi:hypothetical protein